jgi:hypothetical protein
LLLVSRSMLWLIPRTSARSGAPRMIR